MHDVTLPAVTGPRQRGLERFGPRPGLWGRGIVAATSCRAIEGGRTRKKVRPVALPVFTRDRRKQETVEVGGKVVESGTKLACSR